ncbi:MAG: FAD:protein FMN transferase, partial [Planctomycetaceae bacterium]|nr:FAD:protein FMN transferase [Planctomycetaceae bacterium]
PHTGLGLTDRSSVTIIAPSGMQADAWASAVSVLGPKRGLEKINQHAKLDGFIITEDTTVSSNGWEKYLHSNLKKSVSRNVSQQQGTKP